MKRFIAENMDAENPLTAVMWGEPDELSPLAARLAMLGCNVTVCRGWVDVSPLLTAQRAVLVLFGEPDHWLEIANERVGAPIAVLDPLRGDSGEDYRQWAPPRLEAAAMMARDVIRDALVSQNQG